MFFCILFFLIVVIEIVLFSTIRIEINNLKFSTEKYNGRIIDKNYKITLSVWGLQKARLFQLKITDEKLKKIIKEGKILRKINIKKAFMNIKNSFNVDYKTIKKAKKHIPYISFINLKLNIGTESAIFTTYFVTIIAGILGVALEKQLSKSSKNKYIVNPIYLNKNFLNLELNCILETKLIHIIYIIYIINKKGRVNKNVRTSNRRTYGYGYE